VRSLAAVLRYGRRGSLGSIGVQVGNHHTSPLSRELNAAWHQAIYEAAGSRYLEEYITRLWGVLPIEAIWLDIRSEASVEEHEHITAAIERRDATEASALVRRHIEATAELREHLQETHP
jgi:DNA-binding GntR family transcriptional regulator